MAHDLSLCRNCPEAPGWCDINRARTLTHLTSILGRLCLIALAGAVLACTTVKHLEGPKDYSGARLYEVFCASCHGLRGLGDGPVAPFIKADVPDLTLISARNGGQFPAEQVYRSIDGQSRRPSHGPRHMPVWGYEFFGGDGDDETAHKQASDMVERLVAHLASIQQTR